MFKDREEAATILSEKLIKFKNTDALILAIPRGGVPIGYGIAKELGLPLDIILSKKIGHPNNPEFAIGSVSLNGALITADVLDVSVEYINKEADRIFNILKEKYKLFMGNRKPIDLNNKTVILVDDGIATGNTILVTIDAIKKNKPKEIILAIPVAPPSTIDRLSKLVNEFICLLTPEDFHSVGQFYKDFSQVSDAEVIQLVEDASKFKKML
ncbi:MAG: phosphoribosyltransferase family protein [Bacteroidota bacterium]|nr:phosphoribosyltransferase family protein [Bacteroidota bacterium]